MKRTNYCGLINEQYVNQNISIQGWVNKRRDLGGLIFIDLRDREGIVQIVIEPESVCFNDANLLKSEYVIAVEGNVRLRPNPNHEIKTGLIEIVATSIKILNKAVDVPLIVDDSTVSEVNRLTHRIIDLRGQKMQHNIMLRYKITRAIRTYMDALGFIDIETPFLTRSTPEGARDFLVPSRVHKGEFYALPQSPQLFKQLLMVAGFDKYYQIVKCFRDEDLRADRQPEFTQVDIETSFLNQSEIQEVTENLIRSVFQEVIGVDLGEFPTMTYNDAMFYYGSDKPDLRIDLIFSELTDVFKKSSFQAFHSVANSDNGRIVGMVLPSSANLSRKEIDEYTKFVANYQARGLAYMKVTSTDLSQENAISSPIAKFLSPTELQQIIDKTQVKAGEMIVFIADRTKVTNDAMGALRLKIAQDKGLVQDAWKPLWVVDFPMFEYDEEENRYVACHHPFTSPKDEHLELLKTDPSQCIAKAYDMVLNGWELGGGSIRIYDSEVQSKVFDALAITPEEAENKFGFLLQNLQYGAPPHGGLAFGLDRIATMMCKAESIRDVIAFPKTTKAQCLLTNAPNAVDDKQLTELGIKRL